MDIPGNPTKVAAAIPANQPLRQSIFTGESAPVGFRLFGVGRLLAVTPGEFFLDLQIHIPWDDRRMVVPYVVLRKDTIVFLDNPLQKIGGIGLLQQDVTGVFFIP